VVAMFEKIKEIFKKINGIYPSPTFRLVNVNGEPRNKNLTITYQVSGKATTVTEKPSVLINELMILNGFSKQDANLIYNLAVTEKISPALRIISIIFDNDFIKLEIEDVHSKLILQLTAEEIIGSSELLNNFSQADVAKIYFQIINEEFAKRNYFKSKKYDGRNYEQMGSICVLKFSEAK
jgi:hypothetical protein